MVTRTLKPYRDKRLAEQTPEPFGAARLPATGKLFVVQQHHARVLHWDLRLELDGVLTSWAVPKGPSYNRDHKRLAIRTEDHPLDYADFEGRIPDGNYGAGHVIIWDRGRWEPLEDVSTGFQRGKLLFNLHGFKLKGRWALVRLKKGDAAAGKEWLLLKERDEYEEATVGAPGDDSVLSGLTVDELAQPEARANRLRPRLKRMKQARERAHPVRTNPMLATAGEAFDRAGWLFEFKYDGYRVLAERNGKTVQLRSRNGHDLTRLFPEIAQGVARLPYEQFVLDGELIVSDGQGRPNFALLQQRAALRAEAAIDRAAIECPCSYFAFDLLQLLHFDLRMSALTRRKELLRELLPSQGPLRYSEHISRAGRKVFAAARQLGLEGIVAKKALSPYREGRSESWIKVRHQKTGDFVLVGFTTGKRTAADLGALALGEYRGGKLSYAGRVGTGLKTALRRTLLETLQQSPDGPVLDNNEAVHWKRTELVAEVQFREYSPDGKLRLPVFLRLRDDKDPRDCVGTFDNPVPATELKTAAVPNVIVTNPDKVFFPEAGYTKRALCSYYERIAPWMLPYLKDRPIVLTRYPDGIHGKSFFQHNVPDFVPAWVRRVTLWNEDVERENSYFLIDNPLALKYLANLGSVVIHLWHSRVGTLEHPDWLVLDLDPKEAPFEQVVQLALAIGELSDELGLPSFPKTSGASGLHILLPLGNQLTHAQARDLAELMARVIVRRHGTIATIARARAQRQGKVYIDYLQNGHGRLIAAPYTARAVAAGSISMPLRWHEVNRGLNNERFHLGNGPRRLQRLDHGSDGTRAQYRRRPGTGSRAFGNPDGRLTTRQTDGAPVENGRARQKKAPGGRSTALCPRA